MELLDIILPVFGTIIIGWVCRRLDIIKSEGISSLNAYAYYIAFPLLIFNMLSKTSFELISEPAFILINVSILIGTAILVFGVLSVMKVPGELKAVFVLSCIFGNIAYMGIPVSQLAFGDLGATLGSVVAALTLGIGMSIGIFLMQYYTNKEKSFSSIIKNLFKIPLIWSVVLGFSASFVSLTLPSPFVSLISMIGASASPVALFALGVFIFGTPLRKDISKALTLSLAKLTIPFFIALFLLRFFGLSQIQMNVTLVQVAMPLAVTNFVLAEQYRIEEDLVAKSIILSTVLSTFSLSLILLFL